MLNQYVSLALSRRGSDLHIEPGVPIAIRVQGALQQVGDAVGALVTNDIARSLLDEKGWQDFERLGGCTIATSVAGIRCRVSLLRSLRGIGIAVRLFNRAVVTTENLNLHPSIGQLVKHRHGLILVCGPTGSGKTSTMMALLENLNQHETRHIITLESPIEYIITPRRSMVRQREIGNHCPSFEQALLDGMRDNPDVLLVGEMREAELMRQTLAAAETGHLVMSTMHSSSTAEALQRVVSAFPALQQPSVCAQIADSLVAVICQRLVYHDQANSLVPLCEVLVGTTAVKAIIRQGHFNMLATALESGGGEGQLTWAHYQRWLDKKADWL